MSDSKVVPLVSLQNLNIFLPLSKMFLLVCFVSKSLKGLDEFTVCEQYDQISVLAAVIFELETPEIMQFSRKRT
jgi:hypothetical protein